MYDTLLFRIEEAPTVLGNFLVAKVLINGVDFMEIVRKTAPKSSTDTDIENHYNHQLARDLYDYLTSECDEEGVAILTCTCLEDGCSSVRFYIENYDEAVVWHGFYGNGSGDYDYSKLGDFCFEKSQYQLALDNFKLSIEHS